MKVHHEKLTYVENWDNQKRNVTIYIKAAVLNVVIEENYGNVSKGNNHNPYLISNFGNMIINTGKYCDLM